MIMQKSSDCLTLAFSPSTKIRVAYADVTDTARSLEQRHLCGPTAGLVMAESLAAVALLGVDLSQKDETVSLRMQVDGPVEGVLVEFSSNGDLRGYPQRKVINELDGEEEIPLLEAMGSCANVYIIRSVPGKILAQATLEAKPPSGRQALEQYFNISMQTPTSVATCAESSNGYLHIARGLSVECMPDGDLTAFRALQEQFQDDSILAHLSAAPSLEKLKPLLELDDLRVDLPKPLQFGCRCSQQRVENVIAGLSSDELTEMSTQDKPHHIVCHMCGDSYTVTTQRISELLSKK